MQSGLYREYLPELAQSGQLSMDTLDEAVRRVLDSKARMGLFDDPYRSLDPAREEAAHYSPAHEALALDAARKSPVLLKNENGTLVSNPHFNPHLLLRALTSVPHPHLVLRVLT